MATTMSALVYNMKRVPEWDQEQFKKAQYKEKIAIAKEAMRIKRLIKKAKKHRERNTLGWNY